MRMDIENSPGAPVRQFHAWARDDWGLAGCNRAAGDGVISGKCLCSMCHSATVRGERSRRFIEERAKGFLWRHASVNLVKPRDHRTGRDRKSSAHRRRSKFG
jgi:hypothetical protein